MRQAPVAKGNFYISRRSTHTDFNITKSDVKVTTNICNGSPVRSARDSQPLSVFTPDIGYTPQATTSGSLHNKPPATYDWTFGIQRDIGKGLVMDVTYVGNVAHNLFNQNR